MDMDERPDQPAYGRLIEQARDRIKPKLSQNKAAAAAGMSGTRWRQIVYGVASTEGTQVPVWGNPDVVARMAQVVGVSPERMAAEGERPDAADELRKLLAPAVNAPDIPGDIEEFLASHPDLREQLLKQSPARQRQILRFLVETTEEFAEVRRLQDSQLRRMIETFVGERAGDRQEKIT